MRAANPLLPLLGALTLLVATACGSEEGGDPVERDPRIERFAVAPEELGGPGPVQLSWRTSGASTLSLLANGNRVELGRALAAEDEVAVEVTGTTTFELTARGAGGREAVERRTVKVLGPLPSIESFSGPEWVAADGEGIAKALLVWTGVQDATELVLAGVSFQEEVTAVRTEKREQ